MRSPVRSIAVVVAGFLVASTVMIVVETINGRVIYPELGKTAGGVSDPEVLRGMLAAAPAGALLIVIAGWVLGAMVGGWTTAKIAARSTVGHAVALGVLLTLAGIANNLMAPPPLWFWIVSLAVLIPAAYAGARLVPQRSRVPAMPARV